MAKELSVDAKKMLDDFDTPQPAYQESIEETPVDPDTPKKRRRRRKKNVVRVSGYLSPAQYKMLDEMARADNETLTQTIGHAIEELWDKRQRQLTARLAAARRS